jgi:AcrR family transcriptional regulator
MAAEPLITESDGRRLRRDRNRDAVVQALLALYSEGNLDPSTEEIALRSGVSARSLFRYFDDVDDLCQAAITQQQDAVRHLFEVNFDRTADLRSRAMALVAQRAELFEAVESAATVSRLRAPFQLTVADKLTHGRRYLRGQLANLFQEELAQFSPATASARTAAADVLTSFESWQLMRDDQRLTRAKASAAMTDALVALLTAPEQEMNK